MEPGPFESAAGGHLECEVKGVEVTKISLKFALGVGKSENIHAMRTPVCQLDMPASGSGCAIGVEMLSKSPQMTRWRAISKPFTLSGVIRKVHVGSSFNFPLLLFQQLYIPQCCAVEVQMWDRNGVPLCCLLLCYMFVLFTESHIHLTMTFVAFGRLRENVELSETPRNMVE